MLTSVSWTVRRAMPADAAEIARINVDGWRAAYPGIVADATLEALDVDSFTASYRDVLKATGAGHLGA